VRRRRAARSRRRRARPLDRDYLRHDGPEHVLCFRADPIRQGRRPGRAVAADLAGLRRSSTTSRARTGS
jgi:hypothetical protein